MPRVVPDSLIKYFPQARYIVSPEALRTGTPRTALVPGTKTGLVQVDPSKSEYLMLCSAVLKPFTQAANRSPSQAATPKPVTETALPQVPVMLVALVHAEPL